MCNIHKRLLEERNKAGFNQDAMAKAGGVSKRTYCHYESNERNPDTSFLLAIARPKEEGGADADIVYILTGERSVDPALLGLSGTARWSVISAMAIEVMEEVEKERGVKFSNENLHALMGYANTYGTTKQALKAFVDTVFLLAKDLPAKKQPGVE